MTSTLIGFMGDFIYPLGTTNLLITITKEPRSKTLMTMFMVVKLFSADNAILSQAPLTS